MICDRCGKREASIQYVQIINGKREELHLCTRCGNELGVNDFNIPIDISNFFGDIFEEYDFPLLKQKGEAKCKECGTTFEEFLNTGKLGCANCYEVFGTKLDPILKRIQGSNQYIGETNKETSIGSLEKKQVEKNEIEELQEKLKRCIREENYEEAAKIRDEIKRRENK